MREQATERRAAEYYERCQRRAESKFISAFAVGSPVYPVENYRRSTSASTISVNMTDSRASARWVTKIIGTRSTPSAVLLLLSRQPR